MPAHVATSFFFFWYAVVTSRTNLKNCAYVILNWVDSLLMRSLASYRVSR